MQTNQPAADQPAPNQPEANQSVAGQALCPKCRGTLTKETDQYSTYVKCMNCGKIIYPPASVPPESPGAREGQRAQDQTAPDVKMTHTADRGCNLSPSCLECPLPECKYDAPGREKERRRILEDQRMLAIIMREHLSSVEAAQRFGVTERTIFRIKSRTAVTPQPQTQPEQAQGEQQT